MLLLPWSVFEKVRLKPKVSGTFCGSGSGSWGTWSTLELSGPSVPTQTQSLYLHSFTQNFALFLRLAALGAWPKAPPWQKRHWHLIFGASLNWPSPAGGCAGSGEERDHAGFQLGRARGTHSIRAQPQASPRGSALVQGCILPAHLPAQGIRGFSQGKDKDRQSCAAVATPVIPGRTDVEVTLGKLGRRLGSSLQGDGGSCSALSHSPSASHCSSARSDTRHLRQRRAPALGWPGWPSVAPWKVKKTKQNKKIDKSPPLLPSCVEKKT